MGVIKVTLLSATSKYRMPMVIHYFCEKICRFVKVAWISGGHITVTAMYVSSSCSEDSENVCIKSFMFSYRCFQVFTVCQS